MIAKIKKTLLIIILMVLPSLSIFASGGKNDAHGDEFNAGHFIIHHVINSYEWHIAGDLTIPLPVILYDKDKGLDIFLSGKVTHGGTYKGYKFVTHGENEGKIVNVATNRPPMLDLSITKNVAAMFFVMLVMLVVFIRIGNRYKKNPNSVPRGVQSIFEPILIFIRDEMAKSMIGPKYERFLPYLYTVFFFILFSNLLGLVPIFPAGGNITGDISVTFVLALFTFLITSVSGNRNYWKHIFNTPGVPWWMKYPLPIMPMIEIFGMLSKPTTLMIRLFANIMAGHIIVVSFVSLIFILAQVNQYAGFGGSVISVAFLIFMTLIEMLVSFIQAYIFTLLSAVYFSLAVQDDH